MKLMTKLKIQVLKGTWGQTDLEDRSSSSSDDGDDQEPVVDMAALLTGGAPLGAQGLRAMTRILVIVRQVKHCMVTGECIGYWISPCGFISACIPLLSTP